MSTNSIWKRLLTGERAVVEQVEVDPEADVLVARVRPVARERNRCGICRRPARGYDQGRGRRRWRCLDAGTMKVYLEAELPRVACRTHGVVTAAVPWARHGAGHTRAFDQQAVWMAAECSKSAVAQLMRVSWRTVGAIVARLEARTYELRLPDRGAARGQAAAGCHHFDHIRALPCVASHGFPDLVGPLGLAAEKPAVALLRGHRCASREDPRSGLSACRCLVPEAECCGGGAEDQLGG
ncbi:hypothetical protein EF902_34960 [Streptomyces sp. WAC05858]|nr:hypothetical protein EF902_34960 [Streptomyces sp. WAC05858]